MRLRRKTRWSGLLLAALMAAGGASAISVAPAGTSPAWAAAQTQAGGSATAAATPTATTDAADSVNLTVVLQPSDRLGLRTLAGRAPKLSGPAKKRALAKVAPTTSARAQAVAALTQAGMQVTSQTAWSLQVKATVAQAQSLFTVQLHGAAGRRYPTRTAVLPPGLRAVASAVLGLDQRPIAHVRALPAGYGPSDLRAAYGVSRAGSTGAGATIATVQFSGWNSSDLTSYTNAIGQRAPSVTQISVDGTSPSSFDGAGGEEEVALDQEMLAAGAPSAAQRIYFAPNNAQGFYDVYNTIAADAAAGTLQAVSTSWGLCESSLPADFEASVEDAIDRAVTAGATTFAAAGDQGAYDCSTATSADVAPDVDFPAVLPEVIGVGGTTLTKPISSTYAESAWSDPSTRTGSGGGMSSRTTRPSYQSATAIPGNYRLVPDITADADPATGVGVYIASAGGFRAFGGTSAVAPLMAAEFVSTLTSLGCTKGIGDIHAALYAHPQDFRDTTTGSNLLYAAAPGYDEASGLGSPNWAALATDLPTGTVCPAVATSQPGTTLTAGQKLASPNGQYLVTMQSDGNVVLRGNGQALWSTKTANHPGARFVAQGDGNAVVYAPSGQALWDSHTSGKGTSPIFEVLSTGTVALVSTTGTSWTVSPSGTTTLLPGAALKAGWFLHDSTNRMQLSMQSDGNLVVRHSGAAKWATATSRYPGGYLTLQTDGNLVLRDKTGAARWNSHTVGAGPATRLVMQSDGNAVLYKGPTAIWNSHTHI
jgi:subtilase family serine protease